MDKTKYKTAFKVVFLIALLFSSPLLINAKQNSKQNKMKDIPDFAYPKKVIKDAEKSLSKSLTAKNYPETLRALLNLVVADSRISHENTLGLLPRIDSIAGVIPAPYSSLAYLIEAEIYSELYQSVSYKANNRIMSEESQELNPQFWSGNMFASKIRYLLTKALDGKNAAIATPLSDIRKIITDSPGIDSYTVYDFIVYKSIELNETLPKDNSIIPFYKASTESFPSAISLIEQLLTLHSSPSPARNCALIAKAKKSKGEERKILWEEIEKQKESEAVIPLFTYYFNNYFKGMQEITPYSAGTIPPETDKEKFLSLLRVLRERFKTGNEAKILDDIYSNIINPKIYINYPSTVISGKDFPVKLETENIGEFYLLLVKGDEKTEENVDCKTIKNYPVISAKKIAIDREKPFEVTDTVFMSVPAPGKYLIVASKTESLKDLLVLPKTNPRYSVFLASDIDVIAVGPTTTNFPENRGCFVVDASSGKPIENADVVLSIHRGYREPEEFKEYTTDKNGYTDLASNGEIKASYEGSTMTTNVYQHERKLTSKLRLRLFSSQAVYRPGDKLEFFGIVYEEDINKGEIVKNQEIALTFYNASQQEVAKTKVVSDNSGRIYGSFDIPEEGMLGTWRVMAKIGTDQHNDTDIADDIFMEPYDYNNTFYLHVRVEEYKVPPFLVDLKREESKTDSIKFSGQALTYAGMPVSFAEVNYTIKFLPGYFERWNRGMDQQSYTDETNTDAEGRFTIELPLTNIDINDYRGVFTLNASVTDQAGESVSSPVLPFWIADEFSLHAVVPGIINLSAADLKLEVKVNDVTGKPVKKTIEYLISTPSGENIAEGEFKSPVFSYESRLLPSGEYIFKFRIKGEEKGEWALYNSILYRSTESTLPIETALWVPQMEYISSNEEIPVRYGCSYPGKYILCIISSSDGSVEKRWLISDGKMQSVKVRRPEVEHRTYVKFLTYDNHTPNAATITIIPEEQTARFEIVTETFRNKVSAGETENWKFRIKLGNKPVEAYSYALLYDKAMDAISPLYWNSSLFNPSYPDPLNCDLRWKSQRQETFTPEMMKYIGDPSFPSFVFNTYGYPLYLLYRGNVLYSRSMKAMAPMNATADLAYDSVTYAESADMDAMAFNETPVTGAAIETAGEGGAAAANNNNIDVRPIELPVAFFKPALETNKEGVIELEFIVPNFNTTWNLMLGAYTPSLKSTMIELETMASKCVMVKMNAPRFLRTGDDILLAATLYNNSDKTLVATGIYEIFNPDTGEILATVSREGMTISPSGNCVFTAPYKCPDNISSVGLRVYGKTASASDGEETVIPVLPSSQPVVETEPFYLKPDQKHFELTLPEFPDNASVTFTYCDNPLWEVVTSLSPIISPESESALILMDALYANCVGTGVLEANPNLMDGLKLIVSGEAADSLLISNLQKNQDLKIVSLSNTPWVNDANNETLRLSRLSSLLEKDKVQSTVEAIWRKISALQNSDGGWSWCPGMESSTWISYNVLLGMALLKNSSYLPALPSVEPSIVKGLKYCEAEIVSDYYKTEKKNRDSYLRGLWSYLYLRSYFPAVGKSSEYSRISKEALKLIENDWRNHDIFDKATIAILLWREGKQKTALQILESIREFATETERGIFFDNQGVSVFRTNRLATTCQVITAFNEIRPEDDIIDGMRHWLLIEKQAQNWDNRGANIYIVNAMLTSGSSWDKETALPEISIAGQTIESSDLQRLTGSCKVNINLSEMKDNKVEINRYSNSPAWGGIICQYIAPMESVEADAIPDLSVSKEFLKLEDNNGEIVAVPCNEFHTGDKVRINLIIDCGREMDYVVINDERAACVEPIAQLSGYTVIDSIWCYRELRNNAVNLYIPSLPKGRHVISYDCMINEEGTFASGISSMQSLYAPVLNAHSAGNILKAVKKSTSK